MKGIILAGGSGTRLHPMTQVISKQLLPIYDKPMIYYPLTTLMLAGARDVLVISTPSDLPLFQRRLWRWVAVGSSAFLRRTTAARGVSQAYIIGAKFVAGQPSILVLGDNVFTAMGCRSCCATRSRRRGGASVFAYQVADPRALRRRLSTRQAARTPSKRSPRGRDRIGLSPGSIFMTDERRRSPPI